MEFYRAYFTQNKTTETKDTLEAFGVYLKDIPFELFEDMKDAPSNSWYDEDGDDEYIPVDGLKRKAYEMEVEWAYKGNSATTNNQIVAFVNYLMKGDGEHSPVFTLTDNYTNLTRTNVRLVKLHNDAELVRRSGEEDVLIFKTTFKVNL